MMTGFLVVVAKALRISALEKSDKPLGQVAVST
jgi:hypothetical protein